MSSHRLAFRIARREAMRYKGRSILSITLLGLPLLGVAIGASAYDTITLSDAEEAALYIGENEAYIADTGLGAPIEQFTWNDQYPSFGSEESGSEEGGSGLSDSAILAALPVGTRITPYQIYEQAGTEITVETPDGLGPIQTYGYDLTDDIYEAAGVEVLEGSLPWKGEVLISEAAADHLELGVGDVLAVDQGVGGEEYEVSGIVEIPWNLKEQFAVGPMFGADLESGWLVDTPRPFTDEDAAALNGIGATVWAHSMLDRPASEEFYYQEALDEALLTIIGLIVVVVIMEVVLLAGPAFAISARRRTREFALMSANGATPAQIRATVLAGGLLFGLIAAFTAITIGVLVVLAGLPFLEGLVGYRMPGLRVMPGLQAALVAVAITTGLLSALAAALSASRINVVAALMGRTPGRKGSKRWMVIGLIMLGGGLASGFAGVTFWSLPLMSAAVILAQLGLVACTPALLAATAKLGRWLPLAPRMALREAGRNRGSAAPAIAAVLGVVAAGMVFSMVVTADAERRKDWMAQDLVQGTLSMSFGYDGDDADSADWDAALAEAQPLLERRLDDLEIVEVPIFSSWEGCTHPALETVDLEPDSAAECSWVVTRPEENQCVYWSQAESMQNQDEEDERTAAEAAREDPNCNEGPNDAGVSSSSTPASTDPLVVAAYTGFEGEQLDAAVAHLESGGVLVADPLAITDEGTVVLEGRLMVWSAEGEPAELDPITLELPAMPVDDTLLSYNKLLLSPEAVEQMGLAAEGWSRTYVLETSTTVDGSVVEALNADLGTTMGNGDIGANIGVTDYRDTFTVYAAVLVAALCALIALGATAVSTGLIIAEQRKDMTTLGAVGAAPSLRKRFAMWQTVMIALFGAGMGTAAGFIGYALIRQALNRPLQFTYPFETLYGWELPWVAMGILLLAVPLVAALGALVFTKARLPSERLLT